LPDLFGGGGGKTRAQITALLDAVPAYFSQGVITPDRRTATMAFGIRLMPLDRQKDVLDAMRAELHPPKGVDAQLAGLPVLAADANAAVSSACSWSGWCCSPRCARGGGRSCRSCRSRWPPAGRRCCCSRSASR
jgi:hypothetical protein